MAIKVFKYESPLGDIYCKFQGQDLVEISINTYFKHASHLLPKGHSLFSELDAYFKGNLKSFRQRIKFTKGTGFQHKVWLILKEIPYGQTRPYKWVAEKIGNPKATQAVGQALKKNPFPIILPCHRVIASDGSIGGFSYGAFIKEQLLMHEAISIQSKII